MPSVLQDDHLRLRTLSGEDLRPQSGPAKESCRVARAWSNLSRRRHRLLALLRLHPSAVLIHAEISCKKCTNVRSSEAVPQGKDNTKFNPTTPQCTYSFGLKKILFKNVL